MIPAGKYYLEVKKPGYKALQSEIFEVSKNSILNPAINLSPKPKLNLRLPFFGEIVLTIPDFSPPDTMKIDPQTKNTGNQGISNLIDNPAPDFSLPAIALAKEGLPNTENKEISLEEFKSKNLLLTFVSPWSSLSLEQVSIISETSGTISDKQAMLVIFLQESISASNSFMKRGDYSFPFVVDKNGTTAAEFSVTLLPYHVFIDSKGIVRDMHTGVLNKKEILEKVSSIQ